MMFPRPVLFGRSCPLPSCDVTVAPCRACREAVEVRDRAGGRLAWWTGASLLQCRNRSRRLLAMLNHRITLKARPSAIPGPEHFKQDVMPVRPLEAGELLVETMYISIDPAMRSWISDTSGYARGVAIGDVMRAGGIGRVLRTPGGDFGAA